MILNGIEEIRKLLPSINLRDDSDRLDDFISRAQSWVTDTIIGTSLETTLETEIAENATDSHAKLRVIVKRVIADKAYLMFGDEMNIQLSEAGMVVQHNDNMAAASVERRNSLMASLNDRLDDGCDALVRMLMNTSTSDGAYADWRSTEQFAYLTVAFMPTMSELRRHLPPRSNINIHWSDFQNGLLNLSVEMMDLAGGYVSTTEIINLRDLYRSGGLNAIQQQVVESLRDVAACNLAGDGQRALKAAIRARKLMLQSLSDFSAFEHSDVFNLQDVDFNAGHIVDTI